MSCVLPTAASDTKWRNIEQSGDWIFLSSDCQNTSIYFPGCSCWLLQVLASDESINKNNQPHLDLISSNEQQSGLRWTHQTIQTTLLLDVLTHESSIIAKNISILMKYLFAEGRVCFQYMCYRWNVTTQFRWCSNSGDCRK